MKWKPTALGISEHTIAIGIGYGWDALDAMLRANGEHMYVNWMPTVGRRLSKDLRWWDSSGSSS